MELDFGKKKIFVILIISSFQLPLLCKIFIMNATTLFLMKVSTPPSHTLHISPTPKMFLKKHQTNKSYNNTSNQVGGQIKYTTIEDIIFISEMWSWMFGTKQNVASLNYS